MSPAAAFAPLLHTPAVVNNLNDLAVELRVVQLPYHVLDVLVAGELHHAFVPAAKKT